MPTPCLAKDLKYNFLFLQNTSSNAVKSICVKVSVRRNKSLVVLRECQKVCNLQLTCIRSFPFVDDILLALVRETFCHYA